VNFELNDDQQLLFDTVTRLLEKRYGASSRFELLRSDRGWSEEMWQQFAELGLLGLAIEAEYGGSEMGATELSVISEAFGGALVLEPYFSTVIVSAQLIAALGTTEQQARILPLVASGNLMLAFAALEAKARWSHSDVETTATFSNDHWKLNGQKIAVAGGDSADLLIVSARSANGVRLFLVDAKVCVKVSYAMNDGLRGADVLLTDARAVMLGVDVDVLASVDVVTGEALVSLCAEAVGAMSKMLAITVDFLKHREQFGQPLSSFQAIQFQATELVVSLQQSRSLLLLARSSLHSEDVDERRRIVIATKVKIDESCRLFAQSTVQLHGGIGMTMESSIGHYAKRVTMISKMFAEPGALLEELASSGGLISASS
jgi:alkylation response protein AidB-like acyl-CoA dehydrogenase